MLPNTKNPPAAKRREVVERGVHGTGIRVVAVVDDRRAVAARHRSQPAAHRRRAREAGDDVLGARADGLRRRRGRERVRDVLPAEQRQPNVGLLAVGQAHAELRAGRQEVRLAEHAAVGGRRETERDRELAARARDPIAAELIVGVQHRRAGTRQDGRAARPSRLQTPRKRAEAFEMRLGRVRDDADRRLREAARDSRFRRRGSRRARRRAASCSAVSRISVSGTPMSLFKLPCVTQIERLTPKIAAMSSLTVVLPLLPVTATTGIENDARHARAIAPKARRESRTSICGSGDAASRETSAPAAPFRERVLDEVVAVEPIARESRRTTSPAPSVRVSVVTAPNASIVADEAALHLVRDGGRASATSWRDLRGARRRRHGR